jgi:hypothetical protein
MILYALKAFVLLPKCSAITGGAATVFSTVVSMPLGISVRLVEFVLVYASPISRKFIFGMITVIASLRVAKISLDGR